MFGQRKDIKCIGCGYCCKSGPCMPAVFKHGISTFWKWDDGCPELYHNGERYLCRIHHIRKAWWLFQDHCIMPENPDRYVMLHGPIPTIPMRERPEDEDVDDAVVAYGSPFWPGWKEPPR